MDKMVKEQAKFRYLPFTSHEITRFYPMLIVSIESKEITKAQALIDSGATRTFIPNSLADAIGLIPEDTSKLPKVFVTGASETYEAATITLKHLDLYRGDDQLPSIILGRDSIFRKFNVTFMEKRRRFVLERI